MNFTLETVALLCGSYLIGAIPFGLLLAKFVAKNDVRQMGSGNIGATNVFRTSGKILGLLTFFLDGAKGWFVVFITMLIDPSLMYYAAVLAVVGHIFPIFLGFKGGKGVATYIGVLIGLDWIVALIMVLTWLALLLIFRISSVASLVATIITPLIAYFLQDSSLLWVTLFLTALIWVRHASNIKRLLRGEEISASNKKRVK